MTTTSTTTALVTGGNRGIGLAVVEALATRGLRVWMGSRDPQDGRRARAALPPDLQDRVDVVALDVASSTSIDRAVDVMLARGPIDVLVNNAGVCPDGDALVVDDATARRAMEIHVFGPWHLARRLMPPMNVRGHGRIINVSSGWGSFAEGLDDAPAAYGVSKAALNALTVQLAAVAAPGVKVNAMCPGWVRTRMGGDDAPRSPAQGAATVVWLATVDDARCPHGGFFRDDQPIPW